MVNINRNENPIFFSSLPSLALAPHNSSLVSALPLSLRALSHAKPLFSLTPLPSLPQADTTSQPLSLFSPLPTLPRVTEINLTATIDRRKTVPTETIPLPKLKVGKP
ncbi:hypothetical protein I3760_16G038500 [Carya illinoinensis]|nr:hypothetical protein I3760_16G038500 [Carya illinoinensis]